MIELLAEFKHFYLYWGYVVVEVATAAAGTRACSDFKKSLQPQDHIGPYFPLTQLKLCEPILFIELSRLRRNPIQTSQRDVMRGNYWLIYLSTGI